ncbi:hypothetical protein STEG23_030069, partial [Scotinomys teguina]
MERARCRRVTNTHWVSLLDKSNREKEVGSEVDSDTPAKVSDKYVIDGIPLALESEWGELAHSGQHYASFKRATEKPLSHYLQGFIHFIKCSLGDNIFTYFESQFSQGAAKQKTKCQMHKQKPFHFYEDTMFILKRVSHTIES